jgi:TctA family transporter
MSFAGVLRATAGAGSEDFTLLGLFLGRVGNDQAQGRGRFRDARTNHDAVFEGVQLHVVKPPVLVGTRKVRLLI